MYAICVAGMICTSTHLGTLPEAYRWTSIYQEALHPPWWRDQYLAYIVIQVIHLPHPVTRNCIGYTAIQHVHADVCAHMPAVRVQLHMSKQVERSSVCTMSCAVGVARPVMTDEPPCRAGQENEIMDYVDALNERRVPNLRKRGC